MTFLSSLVFGYQMQRGDNLTFLFDIRHLYYEVTDIFWSGKQSPDFQTDKPMSALVLSDTGHFISMVCFGEHPYIYRDFL